MGSTAHVDFIEGQRQAAGPVNTIGGVNRRDDAANGRSGGNQRSSVLRQVGNRNRFEALLDLGGLGAQCGAESDIELLAGWDDPLRAGIDFSWGGVRGCRRPPRRRRGVDGSIGAA